VVAVTATPTTWNDRPFRVIGSPAPTPSASAKAASTTTPPVAYPAALCQFGLVDRGRCRVAPFYLYRRLMAVCPHGGPDDWVRAAVAGYARSVGERLDAGEVGGLAAVPGRGDTGHHVGPGRRLPVL
jgi:hypothetical protein